MGKQSEPWRDPSAPDGRSGHALFVECVVNHNHPLPTFFGSVHSKGSYRRKFCKCSFYGSWLRPYCNFPSACKAWLRELTLGGAVRNSWTTVERNLIRNN